MQLYLTKTYDITNIGPIEGWEFVVGEVDEDGNEEPFFDTWEETFDEVIK